MYEKYSFVVIMITVEGLSAFLLYISLNGLGAQFSYIEPN